VAESQLFGVIKYRKEVGTSLIKSVFVDLLSRVCIVFHFTNG
jgi:hypothetical protein